MRPLSGGRSPLAVLASGITRSTWVAFYIAIAALVLAGVVLPRLHWLCTLAFLVSLTSVILHVVRATLKRQLHPVRLAVGCNVVVLAATSLVRDRLTQQASAAIVAGVPLLSWFCFFGWRYALAPPRPGEALRPPKQLTDCHWTSKLTVAIVLTVEFVQFNALSFNPALGAWQGMPTITSYYSYSFLVFKTSEYRFEQQLWAYCALALGWVLFAIATLALIAHKSAAEARTRSTFAAGAGGASDGAGAGAGGGGADSSEYTMASPVVLVIRTIGRVGFGAAKAYGRALDGCRNSSGQLVYCAQALRPKCLGRLALLPLVPLLLFGAMAAAVASALVVLLIATLVALGLAVCGAFAAIALLHFPILMNMLSVLNCAYDTDGQQGYLVRMPSQNCWQGKHWLFAGASVVTLALLYPVMIHFERKRQSAAEVSYHVRFTACMLIGKLALSACSALLVSTLPAAAYLLVCSVMLVAFLHVNNQREQDEQPACCNVRSVRLLRSMLLTCALWSAIVTLASTIVAAPDMLLAGGLCVLWILTAAYFAFITLLPNWEPSYQAEAATLAVKLVQPVQLPPLVAASFTPNPSLSKREREAAARAGASPKDMVLFQSRAHLPPPPPPLSLEAARLLWPPPGRPEVEQQPSQPHPHPHPHLLKTPGGSDSLRGSLRSGGEADEEVRTVQLSAHAAARPRITFYEFDDGFETVQTVSMHGGGGTAEEAARHSGGGVEGAAAIPKPPPRPNELLPIILAAQPASTLPQHHQHGGMADADLRPGDVIVGVNGTVGLTADEMVRVLQAEHAGALTLRVRRAVMRQSGTKCSHAASSLSLFSVRLVTQCMMLYPQDAEMQRAGCERLCHAVVEASQRAQLPQLISDVRGAFLLPVVINAMEVHVRYAPVLMRAARLLGCLANIEGRLRANIVAAGVLPALVAGLRQHDASSGDVQTMCVHALCDLAAELCSARGSPFGSRRALCEALAATTTHRQVLRGMRAHVGHEGIVSAACKVLLAFQEEFEGSGAMPPPLVTALRSQETISALERAQRSFTHNTEIQLAAEWAVGVGKVARVGERWRAKANCASGERASRAAAAADPAATSERGGGPGTAERGGEGGAAAERGGGGGVAADGARRTPHKSKRPTALPAEAKAGDSVVEGAVTPATPRTPKSVSPRATAALSPAGPPSPRRALQALQLSGGDVSSGARSTAKACKAE